MSQDKGPPAAADMRVPPVDLIVDAETFALIGGQGCVTIDRYFAFDRKTGRYTDKLQRFIPVLDK